MIKNNQQETQNMSITGNGIDIEATLLNLALNDFDHQIEQMDAAKLRHHLKEAYVLLRNFRDQLEELSYQIAEYEKHGWVKF